ncbi:MAG: stage II sporulation protein M [Cyanobacteria bacterium]|nr:stage II sporulation protein M [Cyanobacteriota bacterium]
MSIKSRWAVEREADWKRLDSLLSAKASLSARELREAGILYRLLLSDIARVRSYPDFQHLAPYLNNLLQRAHHRIYAKPPTRWRDIAHFFVYQFPQCFRRHAWVISLAFGTFVLGTVIAMTTVSLDPATANYFLPQPIIDQVKEGHLWMEQMDAAPSQSSLLMTNNIRVAFNAFVGGVFLGIGTLLVMFYNGMFAFGGPMQICFLYGKGWDLLLFMIAHGVIELTTIFIAGGAGMIIGISMLFPGDRPRWQAVQEKGKDALVLVAGCVALLVLAGLIEGMISLNHQAPTWLRLLVAGFSALFLISYLGFVGKDKPDRLLNE